MALLTVPQAAKRLGVSPRTITYWIKDKQRLKATPAAHGHHKLLIEESEVERLLVEMAQEQPAAIEQGPGPASEDIEKRLKSAESWIHDLQRWHSELESRIEALEQGVSSRAGTDGQASPSPLQSHTEAKRTRTPKAAEPPAEGAIEYWQFAAQHGVNRVTFRDQITEGSKRSGERVEAMRDGNKYWLSPEQQLAAIEYWKRHNVPFTLPAEQELDPLSQYLRETTL